MKISSKLLISFTLLFFLTVIMFINVMLNMNGIIEFKKVQEQRTEDAIFVEHISGISFEVYSLFADAYINQDFKENQAEYDELQGRVNQDIERIKKIIDTEREVQLLKDAEVSINKMLDSYGDWVVLIQNQQSQQLKELDTTFVQERDSLQEKIDLIAESLTEEELNASAQLQMKIANMMKQLIILMILSGVLSVLLVFLMSRSITGPLKSTVIMLKEISEGEGDLTARLEMNSKDEISEMAQYVNLTLEKVQFMVKEIKKQTEHLSQTGITLSANMDETASSINQMDANVKSIRRQSDLQKNSVNTTQSSMEQINSNIESMNQQIEQQASNVRESSSAIEEMIGNIHSVTQSLNRNSEIVKELAEASQLASTDLNVATEKIKDVSANSDELLEISSVINNIASQTNLLSMNAAIEAAHAGESGKGFAVVADEIRKLAESSAEQTKTITHVINTIKSSLEGAAASATEVMGQFEHMNNRVNEVNSRELEIRNAMDEQGTGSKEILGAITELNDITTQVRGGSDEMMQGSSLVMEESSELARLSDELSGSMDEMAAGIQQITQAINEINGLSTQNKDTIEELILQINRFKVE